MARFDGRQPDEGRAIHIIPGFVRTADGSCLISTGNTRVICTASIDESVPPFLRGKKQGWVTAEYAMLPASTGRRKQRDGIKKDGRSVEIQRLIGRSLRQAVDLKMLGERSITIDCDVLEADGGTRTASITGGYVALCLAIAKLIKEGKLPFSPIMHQVAAVSCGVVGETPCLDLCYQEDSKAQVDMNLVMNEKGEFIELQGTGEGRAFTPKELQALMAYGEKGIRELMAAQKEALGEDAQYICAKPALIAASGNPHKILELKHLFKDFFQVASMHDVGYDEDIVEDGETFTENAAIKADAVCAATGFDAIADDSGLTVEALGGAPGVYSARYCGVHGEDEKNNDLLLENMKDITNRNCAFVSALAWARPGKKTLTVEGVCPGQLLYARQGTGGFGYDPLFMYETGKTYAEMNQEEKNACSHRARAAAKMQQVMAKELQER